VCAAVGNHPGVTRAEYLPEEDRFIMEFDPEQISLEAVFSAIYTAGKKMGRDYFPELVS